MIMQTADLLLRWQRQEVQTDFGTELFSKETN